MIVKVEKVNRSYTQPKNFENATAVERYNYTCQSKSYIETKCTYKESKKCLHSYTNLSIMYSSVLSK